MTKAEDGCTHKEWNFIQNRGVPPLFAGNMFQDLPQLCETVDNIKRYI
jgi:hypothetical protein